MAGFLAEFPDIASEWHVDRNGEPCPDDLRAGSNRKVWWCCRENPRHEWQAVVRKRTQGARCPICAGRVIGPAGENSLAVEAPALAREWHPKKNGKLRPRHVLAGSHKKVWWKCRKGPDHEWETSLSQRSWRGRGCPFCAGQRVSVTNSLAAVRPELAAQWHPTKNDALTPDDVMAHTHKAVWWRCRERGHEWRAPIHGRSTGGCPYCVHQSTAREDSLAAVLPKLARQWHPTKNGKLKPADVVPGSNRRVWWMCPKGPDHEWQTTVVQRGVEGTGCPFCSRRRISVTNNLATLHPDLVEEWHPTRNGKLGPERVMPQSKRRVWWKCPKGPDHEWQAPVFYRASLGKACPFCTNNRLSVTNSLAARFPRIAAMWHPTRNGSLTPEKVFATTTRRIWWRCDRGHEWQAMPASRVKKQGGCPHCPKPNRRKTVHTRRVREVVRFPGR